MNAILFKEREKERKKKVREKDKVVDPQGKKERKKKVQSLVNGSHKIQLSYKKITQQRYLKN